MSEPVPTVVWENNKRVIRWPDPKPREFLISSQLFEQMVSDLNWLSDTEGSHDAAP